MLNPDFAAIAPGSVELSGPVYSWPFDDNHKPVSGCAMKIRDLMIPDPITVTDGATVEEAIETMKANSIRHLPVVDSNRRLKGFLTLADLKRGLLPYMLGDLNLDDMMIKNPLTVNPDDDIETAALLIYRRKIGGLPVVDRQRLVGIITETDLLRTFIDLMGILSASVRIDVNLGQSPGALNKAMQVITAYGGDIINVSLATRRTRQRSYCFRLEPCDADKIKSALQAAGFEVIAVMQ